MLERAVLEGLWRSEDKTTSSGREGWSRHDGETAGCKGRKCLAPILMSVL